MPNDPGRESNLRLKVETTWAHNLLRWAVGVTTTIKGNYKYWGSNTGTSPQQSLLDHAPLSHFPPGFTTQQVAITATKILELARAADSV
jgi:hypothetical protein